MALQWFDDPAAYLIDLRPGPEERFGRINDAYAQWVLGHGAPFNLTEQYHGPGSARGDFDFAVALRGLETARGRVVVAGDAGATDAVPDPVQRDLYIGRLPLRRESVAPSIREGTGADISQLAEDSLAEVDGADPENLVIIGVIDDAIQVAHERFRNAAGESRVDAAWIQDAAFVPGAGPQPGPGWPLWRQFGRVLHRADISAAIAAHGTDEDAMMAELGLIATPAEPYRPSPLRLLSSHGTHVADVAAGAAPDRNAVNRRIMAVQLPIYATEDTSGACLPAAVISAGAFIFAKAAALSRAVGQPIPVILNFSYGLSGGLRNGTDVMERALRAQAQRYQDAMNAAFSVPPPSVTVLPAGNGNVGRNHAKGDAPAGGQAALSSRFRIQPDDRSSSYAEIWASKSTSHLAVTVTTPTGLSETFNIDLPADPPDPGAVTLENDYVLAASGPTLDPSTIIARVSVDCPACYPAHGPLPDDRAWRVLLSLAPTGALIQGRPTAPAGSWGIDCVATGADAPLRAWLQRDTESLGFGIRGRQVYFEDMSYDAHLFDFMTDVAVADQVESPVTRNGTVSGLASRPDPAPTGAEMISVGAMRWDIAGPTVYSAAGYAPENTPDVLAPADTSRVLDGILGAANRGGAVVPQGGTSNAAPVVTRFLADRIEATPQSGYAGFSARGEIADLADPPDRPNGEPELASNRKVRVERSDLGTLDQSAVLDAAIARDSRRKWP